MMHEIMHVYVDINMCRIALNVAVDIKCADMCVEASYSTYSHLMHSWWGLVGRIEGFILQIFGYESVSFKIKHWDEFCIIDFHSY